MSQPLARLVTWNIERHGPATRQAKLLMDRIAAQQPDLVCLTEAYEGSTAGMDGYEIAIQGVTWSRERPGERKVVLWSRSSWRDVMLGEGEDLRRGALIAATTSTPLGDLRVVGVCMPHAFAWPFGMSPRPPLWSNISTIWRGSRLC